MPSTYIFDIKVFWFNMQERALKEGKCPINDSTDDDWLILLLVCTYFSGYCLTWHRQTLLSHQWDVWSYLHKENTGTCFVVRRGSAVSTPKRTAYLNRCSSYTRRSKDEQYMITRMHDYKQHAAHLSMSHFTRYNASIMKKRSSCGHYPIRDRLHTFSQSNLTA